MTKYCILFNSIYVSSRGGKTNLWWERLMVTFGEKAMIWNRNKEGFGIVSNVLHHEHFTGYMVAVTSYKFIDCTLKNCTLLLYENYIQYKCL